MGILRTDKISGLETPTAAVTGSVYFDGSDDSLTLPDSCGFDSSVSYTVEMWVKDVEVPSGSSPFFTFGASGATNQTFNVDYTSAGNLRLDYYSNAIDFPVELNDGNWHHIAATYDGTTRRLFADGYLGASDTTTNGAYVADNVRVGRMNWISRFAKCYISNLRVVTGTALYTSDFTVPTHALEVIDGTILLCCNNKDNAAAIDHANIGASKSITVNGGAAVSTLSPGLTRDFTSGTEFKGVTTFDTQGYFVPPSGTTEQRGRGRGIFSGGTSPNDSTSTNNIDYITIATLGNSQDFGDTTESLHATSSGSDSTRGLFSGGSVAGNNTNYNTISYITIATTSNAINFGDLSEVKRYTGSTSDKTRTVIAGGANAPGPLTNTIEFVTTQSLGDATNFGDLISATWAFVGTASSPTRGIYFGGSTTTSSSNSVNTIVYVTIQTLGDALDFGDLTNVNAYTGPGGIVSSTTRGIRGGGGGANPFTRVNTIDYVTMASTGNAQDFGDLSYAPNGAMGCSSLTRGIFAGGKNSSGSFNTIEYVTIATTGNAQDFGDMRGTYAFGSALSDCHGGIS